MFLSGEIKRSLQKAIFFHGLTESKDVFLEDCSSSYVCSATAPVSYPASLSNFPNGCQGHPRFYPPPDRPPITKPDPNSVRTRCSFLFNYWHGWTKNA